MDKHNTGFFLVVAFPTDDPMFARGVEWEMLRTHLRKVEGAFVATINATGADWCVALAEADDRLVKVVPISNGWVELKIEARGSKHSVN